MTINVVANYIVHVDPRTYFPAAYVEAKFSEKDINYVVPEDQVDDFTDWLDQKGVAISYSII